MSESVNYFVETFKTFIMNNYTADRACSIVSEYTRLLEKIKEQTTDEKERKRMVDNIEKAYKIVRIELFGREVEDNGG